MNRGGGEGAISGAKMVLVTPYLTCRAEGFEQHTYCKCRTVQNVSGTGCRVFAQADVRLFIRKSWPACNGGLGGRVVALFTRSPNHRVLEGAKTGRVSGGHDW